MGQASEALISGSKGGGGWGGGRGGNVCRTLVLGGQTEAVMESRSKCTKYVERMPVDVTPR